VLVLASCCLIVAVILLLVAGIVDSLVSGVGASCSPGSSSSPCAGSVTYYAFLIPGLGFLTVGAAGLVYFLFRGLN
jgi:hypothetical protein